MKPVHLNRALTGLATLTCVSLLTLSGCGKKDIDRIGDAQSCLDNSTPNTASLCAEKVEGMTSPQSYLIRCVATYIQQGLGSPTTLATMVNSFKGSTGGGASADTAKVLSVLAFTSGASTLENLSLASTAKDHCALSGSTGLQLLSTASYMANLAVHATTSVAGCVSCTPDPTNSNDPCLSSGMSCLKNTDSTTKAALGTVIVAAYQASCTGTGANASTSNTFCQQFDAAVLASGGTGADPATIAQEFLNKF